jgi:hypothetical protein
LVELVIAKQRAEVGLRMLKKNNKFRGTNLGAGTRVFFRREKQFTVEERVQMLELIMSAEGTEVSAETHPARVSACLLEAKVQELPLCLQTDAK